MLWPMSGVRGKAASLVTLLTDLPVIASVSDAGSGAVVLFFLHCLARARWQSYAERACGQDGRVFIAVPRPSRVYR